MTWFDLALLLVLAVLVALAAERRLGGLIIGLGGVLLLRPILLLADLPIVALAVALLAGLLLALLSRRARARRLSAAAGAALGGFGGLLLGGALLLATVTSLPIERNEAGQLVYPPRGLPAPLSAALQRSPLARTGRDILLYPLLVRQGDVPAAKQPVLRALHGYLVVGEPWDGR